MKRIIVILLLIVSILFYNICYGEKYIGQKLQGFCLGMTYNEVMENIKKLNLKVERENYDGNFFVLNNEGNLFQYAFTIRSVDGILISMSFIYDMFNAGNIGRKEFAEMFCKNNIPKMTYKHNVEWKYEFDGYKVIMYDKYVRIQTTFKD